MTDNQRGDISSQDSGGDISREEVKLRYRRQPARPWRVVEAGRVVRTFSLRLSAEQWIDRHSHLGTYEIEQAKGPSEEGPIR